MKTSAIRQAFLDYFASQGHEIVASSSLVPNNDPTLLFTNAGMNQFKDVFLGREQRACQRATSSQRCVRAGGKHNDLENVGYTARHHTFFEMLGNFSFGDYFKREAIHFAWTFLTDVLKIPAEKLWVTVFHEDQEAESIWLQEMGVDPSRFSRLGEKDNFWQMGDTGPCGPCTEIFYDHGEQVWGGPPGSPDDDGDRYIEIWNLVFMQFDRQPDGTLVPLPKPSVDTGMGLERISAVMQGVHSNYEIDLFVDLLNAAATATATGTQDISVKSLRVIADHIRSCAFMIADGVLPSNEGRGYVLRRIIRRAVRHGHMLGQDAVFFYRLVAALVGTMGEAYPELVANQAMIEKVLRREEEQFRKTLAEGLRILEAGLEGLQDATLPGELVFKLYDTHGFPADLTADIARERELTLDLAGFERLMAEQKARSRQTDQFANDYHSSLRSAVATQFVGYEQLASPATVAEIFVAGAPVDALDSETAAIIVLDQTPFYAESGGQIGDSGVLRCEHGVFEVAQTTKVQQGYAHHGVLVQGSLHVGDQVQAEVNNALRDAIRRNHSATHLLHAALRQVLGEHVSQRGSLVTSERLRFDFAHFEAVTPAELRSIERLVNEEIQANTAAQTELMDIDAAKAKGAMALFGEKYDAQVRVLSMGRDGFSIELCGGTHVGRTGDIGLFKIITESGIASGVRRIEAASGMGALAIIEAQEDQLDQLAALTKSSRDNVVARVEQSVERVRQLEKELERQKAKLATSAGAELASQAVTVGDVKVLARVVEGVDEKALREMTDKLKDQLGQCVVVLGLVPAAGKVSLVAGVSKDLISRVKAGEVVNQVAAQVGGKGGGRPDMAMAGGNQPDQLPAALDSVVPWLQARLGG